MAAPPDLKVERGEEEKPTNEAANTEAKGDPEPPAELLPSPEDLVDRKGGLVLRLRDLPTPHTDDFIVPGDKFLVEVFAKGHRDFLAGITSRNVLWNSRARDKLSCWVRDLNDPSVEVIVTFSTD